MESDPGRVGHRRPPVRTLSREQLIVGLLVLYLAACALLLTFVCGSGERLLEAGALARARAVAAALLHAPPESAAAAGARWLDGAAADPFERRALALAAEAAGTHVHAFETGGRDRMLRFAAADGRGGVLELRVPVDEGLRGTETGLRRYFVAFAVLGLLILALAFLGTRGAVAPGSADPQRDEEPQAPARLPGVDGGFLRLFWIFALSLAIFFADLALSLGTSVGAIYLGVVLLSLWSPRTLHTWIAAALGTALMAAKVALAGDGPLDWTMLADRLLSIVAIWAVAALGLRQMRAARARNRAETAALEAQKHNAALKEVLARTEAAEAQLRRGQRLLDTVASMARIGGWEYDVATNALVWSPEVYRIHEVDPSTKPCVAEAIGFFAPEAQPMIEEAVRTAIEHGTPYDLTVPFITATGRRLWVRTIGVAERTDGVTTRLWGTFQDVTEQHETQARLARASRSSSEGHWEYDLGTDTIWASANHEEILGYEPRERRMTTAEFHARVHPDDLRKIEAAMGAHIAEGMPYDIEVRMLHASGEWRWYRSRGAVERDELGRITHLAGSTFDIHQEKLAQEELRQVRARLERAIQGTQDGLWEWDVASDRLWLSPRYAELLEIDPHELPDSGMAFMDAVHPEDRARFEEVLRRHIAEDAPCDLETRLRTGSGVYKWFRVRGRAERDARGVTLTISGSVQDITPQKVAEAALIEAEQRLARAVRGSSDGLFERDLTAPDRPVWYSPRVREMLGYGPDDPFPASVLDLLAPEDRARVLAEIDRHVATGEPFDVTIPAPTRDGGRRWLRGRGMCERDASGRPIRFSGTIQDITVEREAEEALVAAKEAAAAANRAKSDFLANMSHEIRTPMNGVLGMTELLLDTRLDPMQREYAETIRASATSLLGILNDVLDLSKIEAGKLELERVEMDVRECVEDVAMMMAVQAAAKNLEFIVNVDPAAPERVIGDPHRLRQILTNLIGNAIKFTERGEVVVEVLLVGTRDRCALLLFEVRDSGIGMSKDVLSRLFEPFTQADASTTRHYGGTGLGLSIVRRLVELMGGTISVASEPNRGSTFTFTLPCAVPEAGARGPDRQERQEAFEARGRRVLVVDDNHTNRRVLCGQLRPAGYEVETAASADEALEMLLAAREAGRPFDVVIADDQMPDCDGAALGPRVKSHPALSATQLIMLTSMDRFDNVERLTELGFAGYLTKPVRGRELRSCVRRVLELDATCSTGRYARLVTRGLLARDPGEERYRGRILVVEDNAVNQQVARRFLERFGCEVEVVDNGAKAVEACLKQEFGLVLMDVQMPVMDGLAATREIRRREPPGRRTPIVALTASAMTDELERCIAAGMDGLLTKPLELTRLRETLDRYGFGSGGAQPAETAPAAPRTRPPIDLERLRALVGDDAEFLQELCRTFLASSAKILEEIDRAMAARDRAGVGSMAHKLKGGSTSVCAQQLGELAAALEKGARDRPFEELEASAAEIRRALDECSEYIMAEVAEVA